MQMGNWWSIVKLLGSEWLAVYGTACLYTWSEDLKDLQRCFTDESQVDTNSYMNDSAGRNTYWACYSTTLGSLLHELSHVLDVGHSTRGIMARGFENFYAFFTINFQTCKCYSNEIVNIFRIREQL